MTAQSPPFALQNASHSAALFRQAVFSLLSPRGGTVGQNDLFTTAQSTPNMSVQVAAGRGWMPGTQVANVSGGSWNTQGGYFGINDAPTTVTIATADATNPRIDVVYIAVNDQAYSGSLNTVVLGVVTGTPAASPVAPAAPNNSLTVAQVAVAANATSIVSGNITNFAQRAGGLTGILPVGSQLERDFLPAVTKGFAVYRLDLNHIEVYNGSTWDALGVTSYYSAGTNAATNLTASPVAPSGAAAVSVPAGTYNVDVRAYFSLSTASPNTQILAYVYNGSTQLFETDFYVLATGGVSSRAHSDFTQITLASAATLSLRFATGTTGGTQSVSANAIRAVKVA